MQIERPRLVAHASFEAFETERIGKRLHIKLTSLLHITVCEFSTNS